jgi:TRAP-type C4-dicarboxylate transport system substrate-binding protein
MNARILFAAVAATLVSLAPAQAQDAVKLRLSHWVAPGHAMSVWIQNWANDLKAKSGGKLDIEVFPGGQLGPVTDHYDMVRRGTVDIGWILHGTNADRFPLTTLLSVPGIVGTSVAGTKIANDRQLRASHFDPEARGLKNLVLFTNQGGHLHTTGKAVRTPADLKGLRIRFPSPEAKRYLDELGATSVGVPPTQIAENLQKSVIDGVMIDYGGAGIAFKLGGMVKHTTELGAYVSSFALIMNPAVYDKLAGANKQLFDASLTGREEEIGKAWDGLDVPGKQALTEGGMQVIQLSAAERAPFDAAIRKVQTELVAERAKANPAAAAVWDRVMTLAGKK